MRKQTKFLSSVRMSVFISIGVILSEILFVPNGFGDDFTARLCDAQKAMGIDEPLICRIRAAPDTERNSPSVSAQLLQEHFMRFQTKQQDKQTFQCRFTTLSNQDNFAADGTVSRWEEHVMNAAGPVVVLFSQDNCPGCRAIIKRLFDMCRDDRQKTVNTLLNSANMTGMADARILSLISEKICTRFPLGCDLANAFSPKFANVKFVVVENDYDKNKGLFYNRSILFTPTLIMYSKGKKILRVTGANVDCFELTARIAETWHIQEKASHQITSAIVGHSTCAVSPGMTGRCRIDRECFRKLKKLLQLLTSYASRS